jgi:hypothetical protein
MRRVSATWLAAGDRATNAPFTILDGSTVLGMVSRNQRLVPSDFSDAGASWTELGGPYNLTGTTLTVRLNNMANGKVIADAVRIEHLSMLLAVGHSQAAPVALVTGDVSSLPPLAGHLLSPLGKRIVRLLLVSGPLGGKKIAAKLGRSYNPGFQTVLSDLRQWGVLTLGARGYAATLPSDL